MKKLTPFIALVISMCFSTIISIVTIYHVNLAYEEKSENSYIPFTQKDEQREIYRNQVVRLNDGNSLPMYWNLKIISNIHIYGETDNKIRFVIYNFFFNYTLKDFIDDRKVSELILKKLEDKIKKEVPLGCRIVDIEVGFNNFNPDDYFKTK